MDPTIPIETVTAASRGDRTVAARPVSRDGEAAQQFEAYVIKMLLSQMRKTVGEGGLFTDRSTETYREMLDDAIAKRASEAGTFGLAQQILRQIEASR